MAKLAILIAIIAFACICEAVPVAGGFNYGGSGNNNPFRNPWSLLDPASVANMKPNGGHMNAVYTSTFSRNDDGKMRREGVILMNDNGKVNEYKYGTP